MTVGPKLWVFDAARPDASGKASLLGPAAEAVKVSPQALAAVEHVHRAVEYLNKGMGGSSVLDSVKNEYSYANPATHDGMTIVLNANDKGLNITGSYKDGVLTLGSGGMFGTGRDGKRVTVQVNDVAHSGDVITHELGHAILEQSTGLSPQAMKPSGQGRATHEGIADIISSLQRRTWPKGADHLTPTNGIEVFSDPSNPKAPNAATWLITDMNEYNKVAEQMHGLIEPHEGSGVVSHAVANIQARIGWDETEKLVFDSIREKRLGRLSFDDVAQGLRNSATSLWGAGDKRATVVNSTLTDAGL